MHAFCRVQVLTLQPHTRIFSDDEVNCSSCFLVWFGLVSWFMGVALSRVAVSPITATLSLIPGSSEVEGGSLQGRDLLDDSSSRPWGYGS